MERAERIAALKRRIVAEEAKAAAQEERADYFASTYRPEIASAANDLLQLMKRKTVLLRERLAVMEEAAYPTSEADR